MRRLLESLVPDARPIYWKWVGGVFTLYVVLLLTAASAFVNHDPVRKVAREPAAAVAREGKLQSVPEITPVRQVMRY
jgi:hypothetical protein